MEKYNDVFSYTKRKALDCLALSLLHRSPLTRFLL
jgi:hypothetical protein